MVGDTIHGDERSSRKGGNMSTYKKGRVYKVGHIWYIDFNSGSRRVREAVSPDKKFAQAVLYKALTKVAEGKFLDIRKNEQIKFKDFAAQFLATYSINKKSYKKDVQYVAILNRWFGNKALYEVTQYDVEKFKTERAQEVSGDTANRNLTCLKTIFNKAIAWGKMNGVNPVKGVKYFPETKRLVYLEVEEIKKLIDTADLLSKKNPDHYEHLKYIIITALHTGMRKSEILNLKWADLDIHREQIFVGKTKSGKDRYIPMDGILKKLFFEIKKHPDSPFIFCNREGKRYGDIKKGYLTICKSAGIIDRLMNGETTRLRFHDLRHSFASQMRMGGVPLEDIAAFLGHSTLEMSLRYAHLGPESRKRDFDILCSRISPKVDTKMTQPENCVITGEEEHPTNHLLDKVLV